MSGRYKFVYIFVNPAPDVTLGIYKGMTLRLTGTSLSIVHQSCLQHLQHPFLLFAETGIILSSLLIYSVKKFLIVSWEPL